MPDRIYFSRVDVYLFMGDSGSNEWGQSDEIFLKIPAGQPMSLVKDVETGRGRIVLHDAGDLLDQAHLLDEFISHTAY